MKTLNNEITVQRNESFIIDKTIVNRDGSPYVISSAFENPYFLLAVSSARYTQSERYLLNIWLDLNGDNPFPRFNLNKPVDLNSVKKVDGSKAYPNGFSDITSLQSYKYTGIGFNITVADVKYVVTPSDTHYIFTSETGGYESQTIESKTIIVDQIPYVCTEKVTLKEQDYYVTVDGDNILALTDEVLVTGFINGIECIYYPSDTVFYVEEDGNVDSRYWSYGDWVNYKCRIVVAIPTTYTREWVEQNYLYSITLVDGEKMLDFLRNCCASEGIPYTEADSEEDLYTKLIDAKYNFPKYFKFKDQQGNIRELGTFNEVVPILPPTKLTVRADLHGGL